MDNRHWGFFHVVLYSIFRRPGNLGFALGFSPLNFLGSLFGEFCFFFAKLDAICYNVFYNADLRVYLVYIWCYILFGNLIGRTLFRIYLCIYTRLLWLKTRTTSNQYSSYSTHGLTIKLSSFGVNLNNFGFTLDNDNFVVETRIECGKYSFVVKA